MGLSPNALSSVKNENFSCKNFKARPLILVNNMPEHILSDRSLIDVSAVLKKIGVAVGDKVADLGVGGTGTWTFATAEIIGESGTVYAADILKHVLQAIESKAHLTGFYNIQTVWTNLEIYGAAKIPEKLIDFAYVNNVLHQSKQPENILKEAGRLLKKGGKLLVTDWSRATSPFGPSKDTRIDPDVVKKHAEALGFKLIQHFSPGKYHFALVFQKE
ncbi:MAG: hypothetical protein A3B74_05335 [Candidatus Kerfeldbacteria bacterium RIFCSPHIGHO2_02_FULL_42_14]|uniref:Methyltransferase domain-containing protein n=1 Tax=Candidatus Kerfeldbacteria bacterium RIFCSPHIGHO2_02_FULL_42_14 TaxID=1798540 RepID=A0A1G2AT11_9BACT|nr:MAG: hypothetical protein A3B74_05335 [Candidatus Kerfeldbacteria bacterium RIFCSPHIGHO2_02_FULL_42_14]OGY81587.1 MAG: hypothetical protein A3E60_01905 [Candidatus Kerfeldbacteria bacterium RIFCSPHIGHO2_12_FULL_42_13]OGY83188.1 MAG: hypothetical protein A3I91_03320 [Candidatus Kerfeldbacteria bacterium RIFCSPLOWO2_02_FULL_42_19]OGY86259.1 MAG: hypothetical protein A3G01_00300 [Candidatus Kerfeldbacteria bacterium RIFCSPLOWO2_12_FULL_43_9]